jgi:hypothetical protein
MARATILETCPPGEGTRFQGVLADWSGDVLTAQPFMQVRLGTSTRTVGSMRKQRRSGD